MAELSVLNNAYWLLNKAILASWTSSTVLLTGIQGLTPGQWNSLFMTRLLAASLTALLVLSSLISWLDVWVLRPRGWHSYEEGENPGPKGQCGTMLRR